MVEKILLHYNSWFWFIPWILMEYCLILRQWSSINVLCFVVSRYRIVTYCKTKRIPPKQIKNINNKDYRLLRLFRFTLYNVYLKFYIAFFCYLPLKCSYIPHTNSTLFTHRHKNCVYYYIKWMGCVCVFSL